MNIKDSYIHNGTAVLKDVKVENSVLKKILAGKDANDAYLGWETVCDLTGIKPNAAGTADKVGHKLTFSGGVTGDWDGSADKTVAIPTKSSWNYDDVYLKLSGNGTTNPLTGTIYIKDVNGIILNSKDKDLNIWEVYGNSGVWASQYGFNLQYLGTSSGNNNDLVLWAHNQAGTHVETYRVKQDGTFIFKAAPKVGTNVMYHAGNLTIKTLMGTTAIGDSDEPVYWNGNSFVKAGAYPTKASWNYDDRYLKLSGGTLTGVLHLLGSKYEDSANTGALDLANSDIYGVNSIKFADLAESAVEGLQWYRDATHVDSLWIKNGVIYFSPNRTWGGTVTNYTVWHSGNDGTGSGLDADLLDGKHASDFSLSTHTHDYIAKLRRLNEVFGYSSFASGMFPPALFELKTAGYPVYSDPEFMSGYNSISVYNNYGNGTVTITREHAGDHANSSGFQLKITTAGEATPGCGGFYQSILSRANAIFVQIFRAKIPVGYNVNTASNSMGTNYQDKFITDRAGTGKWEWYARVVYCGSSGSFSSGGHVYLSANSGYSATSVTWYLSYCNVIDITKGAYDGLRTRYADSADSVVWSNVTEKPTTINGYGITDALKIDGSNGTAAGVSALINKLDIGSSTPTDTDYYVCQYVGGGTSTTTYHRRPMSAMWNWIKTKTDTLYPTKSGSGAAGTWGISITGSAGSVAWGNITGKPNSFTPSSHTHTFASLTEKPTTISGYGITDGLRRVTLANNVENDFNTFENLTLTGRGDPTTGSSLLNSPWTTQPAGGFGTLTYLWSSYGLQLTVGYNSNDIYIRSKYYHDGGSNWSTKWDKILNSSNYNSYSPKLDGTGAIGTWKINISGNAATATTATNLSKKPSIQVGTSDTKKITITAGGKTSDEYIIPFATASDKLYAYTIAAGTDVNTLKDFKYYVSNSTSVCASIVNGPIERTNGEMWFLSIPAGASSYGQQLYYSRGATNWQLWTRTWANNSFSPWVQFIHSGNISSQSVSSATTSTYASNVGSAGTAGTNYVTASKVISACNWYDTMISSDSDTVINRWSEIVAFVAGFKETPDLATFLNNNYLAKAGGTMTGPLKWANATALPQQTSPQYFLCIDAFADGGTTKWTGKADTLNALTGLTSTAIGDSDEPVYWNGSKFVKAGAYPTKSSWNYDDRYLKLSGGKITGPVTFEMSNDRKIYINNSDNETYWSLISFQQKGTEYGTLGTAGSTDLQWNGHNLYHAGNLTASVIGSLGTLSNNISGNAATATKATQDGNGNVIANTYLHLSGGTLTGTLGKSNNYIFKPNGGDFRTTNPTYTGAICVSLPANIGNTMFSMWIDVYNYSTNKSFSVHVGGYTYNNSTFSNSPFAMVYGASHKVRLTYDNGFKIYIGETNSTWSYPQISIRDVVLGYSQSYSNWYNNWSISFVTSFPTINKEITRYAITTDNINSQSVNYANSAGSVAWGNVTGKPATATRWPSWSEVTDKPIFTTWSETSSAASYSLSNAAWTNTITLPTTAGSYILNIVSGNSTLTGVFSIGASDNAKDEISLHLHGNGPRLYARTNGTTLQLSSNDASATSRSVTIKYRRMI